MISSAKFAPKVWLMDALDVSGNSEGSNVASPTDAGSNDASERRASSAVVASSLVLSPRRSGLK